MHLQDDQEEPERISIKDPCGYSVDLHTVPASRERHGETYHRGFRRRIVD